jgi:hypothetical protein
LFFIQNAKSNFLPLVGYLRSLRLSLADLIGSLNKAQVFDEEEELDELS